MKKSIKYFTLSIATIAVFSCGNDDHSITYVDNEVKTDLIGTISLSSSTGASPGTMVSFNYTIPQGFEVESTLEITSKSSYSAFDATPYTTKNFLTVPAGVTSGSGQFEMAGATSDVSGEYNGIPEYASVSITGIALTQPEDGEIDDPYVMTSDEVSVVGFDFHNPFMIGRDDTLMLSLDWLGPYNQNDLDLYVFDDPFTGVFESSESGSRFEGDFFNNPANELHPDGEYIFRVGIYNSVDANPIPFRLVLTHPNMKTDVYEGTVDPSIGFIDPVGFTKSTDSEGVITFETYAL